MIQGDERNEPEYCTVCVFERQCDHIMYKIETQKMIKQEGIHKGCIHTQICTLTHQTPRRNISISALYCKSTHQMRDKMCDKMS